MRSLVAALMLIGLTPSSRPAGADEYKLDPGHTYIGFAVKHFGLTTVRGNFRRFSGSIKFDSAAIENTVVEVTIASNSLFTGNGERDDALMGPMFLDTKQFPLIGFKSTKVARRGDQVIVAGNLTIHGVTHQVELPIDFTAPISAPQNGGKLTLGAEGKMSINRKEYGINFNKVMDNGSMFVGDEVKIEINTEAIRSGPAN